MPRMVGQNGAEGEHRIRLNNPELSEIVASLELSRQTGKGNLKLVESLIGRLRHPKAGGNWDRHGLS